MIDSHISIDILFDYIDIYHYLYDLINKNTSGWLSLKLNLIVIAAI